MLNRVALGLRLLRLLPVCYCTIFISILLLWNGEAGEFCEPSDKGMFFPISGSIQQKDAYALFYSRMGEVKQVSGRLFLELKSLKIRGNMNRFMLIV